MSDFVYVLMERRSRNKTSEFVFQAESKTGYIYEPKKEVNRAVESSGVTYTLRFHMMDVFFVLVFLFSLLSSNAYSEKVHSISLLTYPVEAIYVINNPRTGEMVIGSDYHGACNLCGIDSPGVELAYKAPRNVLNDGTDYSNGACFGDGVDLKVNGENAYRYKARFKLANKNHNVLSVIEPPPLQRRGKNNKYFEYTYISTSGINKTIFWKYTKEALEA
ncbi:TPA: hypothetical protein ACF2P6_002802, partial [Legionella pneumophila]